MGEQLVSRDLNAPTNTCGGGRDQTAVVGHAAEVRGWVPGATSFRPEVDPTARVEAGVTIDAGVQKATRVGARTWLMKKVHVAHDVQIGEDCELAPMANVLGECVIGDRVKVGGSAVLRPRVRVGDDARIGCGAVVVKDVPAGVTVAGNPARELAPKWPADARRGRMADYGSAEDCRAFGVMPDYDAAA